MRAKETVCRVTEKVWLTPTVFRLRFEPLKPFKFQPGQFLSVIVPADQNNPQPTKRCYSFASSPYEAYKRGYYELCIKYVTGGRGTGYLAALETGDTFKCVAPYGDMQYMGLTPGRSVCFIATGSGIAPFRSMLFSEQFHSSNPVKTTCLMGFRTEDEVLYKKELERLGIEVVAAVSQPTPEWTGYTGRVTDWLRAHPQACQWHQTDFYICGNGEMVTEVCNILQGTYGVPAKAIHKEAFTSSVPSAKKTQNTTEEAA